MDVIRGQFFSRVHCKVHLLTGKLAGFPVDPGAEGCYVLLFRFWGMSGIVDICGDSMHSFGPCLHSFLGLLPPFCRLIASLCPKYNDLPISKFLFQYNFACGDEFVEGNLIFCCTG